MAAVAVAVQNPEGQVGAMEDPCTERPSVLARAQAAQPAAAAAPTRAPPLEKSCRNMVQAARQTSELVRSCCKGRDDYADPPKEVPHDTADREDGRSMGVARHFSPTEAACKISASDHCCFTPNAQRSSREPLIA